MASVEGSEKVLIKQPLSFRTKEDGLVNGSVLLCAHVDGATPGSSAIKLGNYQGGGRKCGVVSQSGGPHSILALLLLLMPLLLPLVTSKSGQDTGAHFIKPGLALALFIAVFLSSYARAEEAISAQNLQTFSPVNSGIGLTDEAGDRSAPSFSLGIFADQSKEPFVRKSAEGETLSGSVESVSTAHLTVSIRILERIQAQVHLPYHHQVVSERSTQVNDSSTDNREPPVPDAAGNGAAAIKVDLWIGDSFSASAKIIGTTPLAKGQSFAADDSSAGGGSLLTTIRTGSMTTSAELGKIRRVKSHEWSEDETLYRIEGFEFAKIGSTWEANSLFEFGAAMSGRRYLVEQTDERRFTALEWTIGMSWHATALCDLSVGGGTGVGDGLGAPSTRVYAGIVLKVGVSKSLPTLPSGGRVIANSSPGAVGATSAASTTPPIKAEVGAAPSSGPDRSVKSVVWRGRAEQKISSKSSKLEKSKGRKIQPKKNSIKTPQIIRE